MRDHSLWRGWAQQGQGGGQSRPLDPPWPRPGRGQSGWWGWVSSLRSSACTCVPHLEAVACWPGPGAGAGEGTLVGGAHRAGELGRGGDKCCYYLLKLTSEVVRQSSPVVQPPAAASVTPQPPQQRGHEEGFTSRLGRQVRADNQQLEQNIYILDYLDCGFVDNKM